jgi:hypothetical protein
MALELTSRLWLVLGLVPSVEPGEAKLSPRRDLATWRWN